MRRRILSDLNNGYRIRSFPIGSTGRIESLGISLEQVDRYSKYLSNHSLDMKDRNLCNCTDLSSLANSANTSFIVVALRLNPSSTYSIPLPLILTENSFNEK